MWRDKLRRPSRTFRRTPNTSRSRSEPNGTGAQNNRPADLAPLCLMRRLTCTLVRPGSGSRPCHLPDPPESRREPRAPPRAAAGSSVGDSCVAGRRDRWRSGRERRNHVPCGLRAPARTQRGPNVDQRARAGRRPGRETGQRIRTWLALLAQPRHGARAKGLRAISIRY
jgi:hypothetical protein